MNKGFFYILLFLCLALPLSAFGAKEKKSGEVPVVRVSGTVRLVGQELFQEIVITGSDNEWYVDKEDMPKLQELQHLKVTVEGEETVVELRFANGLSAGVRRTLRNVKVISIE